MQATTTPAHDDGLQKQLVASELLVARSSSVALILPCGGLELTVPNSWVEFSFSGSTRTPRRRECVTSQFNVLLHVVSEGLLVFPNREVFLIPAPCV